MRTVLVAALAAVSVVHAGCAVCVEGDSWCTGDGLTRCEYGSPAISFCCAQDGCQDVEVNGRRAAVCSPTPEPDPRCTGAAPVDNICVDGVYLHCNDGYGNHEEVCAGACVSPMPGSAFCALADQPDPRCAFDDRPHCFGDVIVDCAHGYAVLEQPCVAPYDTCVTDRDNLGTRPRCATAEPDPACVDDPPGRCQGTDILGCAEGRRTFEPCSYSCYQNPIDSMFPEAFCRGPDCSYD